MLRTPYNGTIARKCVSANVASNLSSYRFVRDNVRKKSFEYVEFYNVYLNLQTIDRAMIVYYGLTSVF